MSIDTNWELKANHWEREAKRLIVENVNLKSEMFRLEAKETPAKAEGISIKEIAEACYAESEQLDSYGIIETISKYLSALEKVAFIEGWERGNSLVGFPDAENEYAEYLKEKSDNEVAGNGNTNS